MSSGAAADVAGSLPRTRLTRHARSAWPLAVAATLLANLLVIGLLAGLGNGHRPAPGEFAVPPMTVQPIPPPAATMPAPAPSALAQAAAAMAIPPVPVSLPALADLVPALAVPTAPTRDPLREPLPTLALGLPAFTAAAPGPAGTPDAGPATTGPTATRDQPARLPPGVESLLERNFPVSARQRGITGETRVVAAIAADGTVTAVTVLASTPPGVFEAAARRALGRLRCQPAISGGQAIASNLPITLTWTLRNP
jgi:protein TonB